MYQNPHPGKFFVFEGPDGSGKTLQSELLAKYLEEHGYSVVLTFEPTRDGTHSQQIQDVLQKKTTIAPEELQKLFTEDRREHFDRVIRPALHDGKIVISDRYFFSTFAYGMLDVPLERLVAMNDAFILPDIAFVIDVEVATCMERIQARQGGEQNWRSEFFHHGDKLRSIIENYRTLGTHFPDLVFIDGDRSPAEIHVDVVEKVEKILK